MLVKIWLKSVIRHNVPEDSRDLSTYTVPCIKSSCFEIFDPRRHVIAIAGGIYTAQQSQNDSVGVHRAGLGRAAADLTRVERQHATLELLVHRADDHIASFRSQPVGRSGFHTIDIKSVFIQIFGK